MHIAFLNPQGNFDPQDRYWTAHPDFGGQLVYVKEVALALGRMGHQVDILIRRIVDPECILFARKIAELKLTTVGPLPSTIDRDQVYARLPRTATDVRLARS